MIRSVEIKGLRGIREGRLDDLTPLVVLVGPNGCGKSTLLDAILLGASPVPSDAFQRLGKSRTGLSQAARWIMFKSEDVDSAEVTVVTDQKARRVVQIVPNTLTSSDAPVEDASTSDDVMLEARLLQDRTDRNSSEGNFTVFAASSYAGNGNYDRKRYALDGVNSISIIEYDLERNQTPLHKLYTDVIASGRREEANKIIREVVPGCLGIEIVAEDDKPIVHLLYDKRSVPVALAGDGIQSLLRSSLELASRSKGIVLLEEPEVHQHPGALRQTARAMWAAVRRDIQVIISTHSIELIDLLLGEVQGQEELDKMSVYGLMLKDGCLRSSRTQGTDIAFARTTIGDDLR